MPSGKLRKTKMLHLFRNVYLSIDELMDINQNRLVLSRDYGHAMDVNIPNIGSLVLHTDNFDGLVGSGKRFASYLDFFKFVDDEQRVLNKQLVIYADKGTFIKLAVNFFKALLPNAQPADIYRMLKMYSNSVQIMHTSPYFYAPVGDVAKLNSKMNLQPSEITAAYHSATSTAFDYYDFFENKRADVSIELVAATHGFNSRAGDEINRLLRYFIAKQTFFFADEARLEIAAQALRGQARTVLNLADTGAEKIVDTLQHAASTAIMFDNSIFRRTVSSIDIDRDFSALNNTEITVLAQTTYKVLRDLAGWRTNEGQLGVLEYLQAAMDLHNPAAWAVWKERLLDNLPGLINDSESSKVNTAFSWYVTDARHGDRGLLRPYVINGCQ